MGKKREVFLSHIHEESELARLFRDWIESTFAGQVDVFVSCDKRDIPVGSKWLPKIDSALKSSGLFVMLCSPTSLTRSWINFEAGCAWIKEVPLMLICHSGMRKDNLPSPMSEFQAIEINEDTFVKDFFGSMGIHLKISKLPRIDIEAMCKELKNALKSIPSQTTRTRAIPNSEKTRTISTVDALNTLESWMKNRSTTDNTKVIIYLDLDRELELPDGTTKKHIQTIAERLGYGTVRKGKDTILLRKAAVKLVRRESRYKIIEPL